MTELEKLKKVIEIQGKAIDELIFHFHDYGMEEESLVLLMAVNEVEQTKKQVEEILKGSE
jgi:hypothetical protein